MRLEIEFDVPSIQLELPAGAVRASQWLRQGDHPAVRQDYLPGPCGDVDIDSYFIEQDGEYTLIESGDWIIDMVDGSYQVIKGESPPLEEVLRDGLRRAVNDLFPRSALPQSKAWPTYDYD